MDILKGYVSPRRQGAPAAARGKAGALQQRQTQQYGIQRMVRLFCAWKLLLLTIACASPEPGYDTSTQILFDQHRNPNERSLFAALVEHLALRLTRWDGIYFASASLHGQVYEQEWAFSWASSRITSLIARVLFSPLPLPELVKHVLACSFLSHITHLLAVLTLYYFTLEIIPASSARKQAIAFTASVLHVVSPAGLFLSAPYTESTFAFLNFAGTFCYLINTRSHASYAYQRQRNSTRWLLLAGSFYGAAAMIRSNGLLSGIPLAWDAITTTQPWKKFFKSRDPSKRRRFALIILAGSLIALGFTIPQIVAYREYCTHGNTRPWCTRLPPSIYNWVQSHYWGVGFLKYWTPNNAPLFLLAMPMLATLIWSSYLCLQRPADLATLSSSGAEGTKHDDFDDTAIFLAVLRRLAVPQLVLAVLAATSFHVQIINRISSGYVVWCIVLAIGIHAAPAERARVLGWPGKGRVLEWMVRAMVMYAVVQGGLFACFLPPA